MDGYTEIQEENVAAVLCLSINTYTNIFNEHLLHLHGKLAFCWTQFEGVTEEQVIRLF